MVKPQRVSTSPNPPPQSHKNNVKIINVIQECQNAINISLKNFPKGLKIANKLCSEYRDVPYFHAAKSEIFVNHASTLGDSSKEKKKILKEALEAVEFALVLEPKNPFFILYRAVVLHETAKDETGYSMVVKECRDALQMQPNESLKNRLNVLINEASNAGKKKHNSGKNPNPVEVKLPVARGTVEREYTQQEAESQKRCYEKSEEKRVTPDKEFITKNGEYWRNLSFDKKCEILDVSVEDLESFFVAGENRNLRVVSVCGEAVEWYISKGHWVTWTCCLCGNDEFDDWGAFLKHMDDLHFRDVSPKITENLEVNVQRDADDLKLNDDGGKFILDKQGLVGWLGKDRLANDIFLLDWLRSDSDIDIALARWDDRKMKGAQTWLEVSEEIEELVKKKMEIDLSLQSFCASKDEGVVPEIKIHTEKLVSEKISSLDAKITALKQTAIHHSAFDYRETLMPIIKSFIQARLNSKVEEAARKTSDAAMEDLVGEVDVEGKREPKRSKKNKKKKGKQ